MKTFFLVSFFVAALSSRRANAEQDLVPTLLVQYHAEDPSDEPLHAQALELLTDHLRRQLLDVLLMEVAGNAPEYSPTLGLSGVNVLGHVLFEIDQSLTKQVAPRIISLMKSGSKPFSLRFHLLWLPSDPNKNLIGSKTYGSSEPPINQTLVDVLSNLQFLQLDNRAASFLLSRYNLAKVAAYLQKEFGPMWMPLRIQLQADFTESGMKFRAGALLAPQGFSQTIPAPSEANHAVSFIYQPMVGDLVLLDFSRNYIDTAKVQPARIRLIFGPNVDGRPKGCLDQACVAYRNRIPTVTFRMKSSSFAGWFDWLKAGLSMVTYGDLLLQELVFDIHPQTGPQLSSSYSQLPVILTYPTISGSINRTVFERSDKFLGFEIYQPLIAKPLSDSFNEQIKLHTQPVGKNPDPLNQVLSNFFGIFH
jgi:hypothetical protein